MTGIYAIKHRDSNTVYIGQAVDIERRWVRHRWNLGRGKHVNAHLQRAWNKYGESAFDFNPLELCDAEDLTVREQWYLDNFHYKYNIAKDARSSMLGLKASPETRAKISAAQRGREFLPEHRAKISAGQKLRHLRKKINSIGAQMKLW